MASGRMTLGVCVMRGKLESMALLLKELEDEYNILTLSEQQILHQPVDSWPPCDALISFHSKGFPLEKAQAYARLHQPVCFNDLERAELLLDRRRIYQTLKDFGLPTPVYAVHDHTDPSCADDLVVHEDYVEIKGVRINKPFVEKPADADDHGIRVYYPHSVGGGHKQLLRKVGNKSSEFFPGECSIRTDGVYIYEEFLPTEGTDVKVYTIGLQYAYAEARKAPTLDGKVLRDAKGKEIRYPVLLSPEEKEMARTVVLAFGQSVCGFDILRSNGGSYICDVNGWSFVKSSSAYYLDAAAVLRSIVREATMPYSSSPPDPMDGLTSPAVHGSASANSFWRRRPRRPQFTTPQLRMVVGIVRHGDRTPKQKMKMHVRNERLLAYFQSQGLAAGKEIKLKNPLELQQVLDIADDMLRVMQDSCEPDASEPSSDADADGVELHKLKQLHQVLQMAPFNGINRKIQAKMIEADAHGTVLEALLVLKWGGELTEAGREQSEALGHSLRLMLTKSQEVSAAGPQFHHLHSAYGHEIKFYSSDEGRVQMTAAATAKGLLELDGPLGPILVSLVRKDAVASKMLNDTSVVAKAASAVKQRLHAAMQLDVPSNDKALQLTLVPTHAPQLVQALHAAGNPMQRLRSLQSAIKSLVAYLDGLFAEHGPDKVMYHGETLLMLIARWHKLERDIYQRKKASFDISKVPDIYDCAKYDVTHNFAVLGEPAALVEVHDHVKRLAMLVVPLEYGSTLKEMIQIGVGTLHHFFRKVRKDTVVDDRDFSLSCDALETFHKVDPRHAVSSEQLKTRLYFTSESHVYALFNLLRWAPLAHPDVPDLLSPEGRKVPCKLVDEVTELSYLTRIMFSVYEMPPKSADADGSASSQRSATNFMDRFAVRIKFSANPGSEMKIVRDMMPLEQLHIFLEKIIAISRPLFDTTHAAVLKKPIKIAPSLSHRLTLHDPDSAREEDSSPRGVKIEEKPLFGPKENVGEGGEPSPSSSASTNAQANPGSMPSSPAIPRAMDPRWDRSTPMLLPVPQLQMPPPPSSLLRSAPSEPLAAPLTSCEPVYTPPTTPPPPSHRHSKHGSPEAQ